MCVLESPNLYKNKNSANSFILSNYQSVDFNANVFAPYLSSTVTELIKLIGEADTLESKRRIASSLVVVIERAQIRVRCARFPPLLFFCS